MHDNHYFADVDLPFHVWVREPSGTGSFRWVLREAPSRAFEKASVRALARDVAGKRQQTPT